MFDTETTAIASIMVYPHLIGDCGFEILFEDFQVKQNQVIYLTVQELIKQNIPTTPSSIYNSLRNGNQHLQIDQNYLHSLPKYAEPSVQVLEAFKEDAVTYRLESFAYEILAAGKAGHRGLTALNSSITRLQNYQKSVTKKAHNALLFDAVQALMNDVNNPHAVTTTIYSPWANLNQKIGSFVGGEILSIGARPGMGKTHWIVQLVEHIAKSGSPAGIISTEMNFKGLGKRFIEVKLAIPTKAFRGNKLSQEQSALIATSMGEFNLNIDLAYVPSTTKEEVLQHVRRMISEGRKTIVIDYLQSISFGNGKGVNLDAEYGEFYKALKGLALEHDVFFIIISQLSREVEKSRNKKPDSMIWFKGSGFIESHSDMVWTFWRPEYYNIFEDATGKDLRRRMRIFGLKGRDGIQFNHVDLFWNDSKYVDKLETVEYEEADF